MLFFLKPGVGRKKLRRKLRIKLWMALQLLEDETCQRCGHPIWWCHATLNTVQFDVETRSCYADLAIEKWKHQTWGEKGRPKMSVEEPYAVIRAEGADRLPTRDEGLRSME